MRATRWAPLAGLVTVLGSVLWLFALDMRTAILALVKCWSGGMAAAMLRSGKSRRGTVGFVVALAGALGWLLAWLAYDNPVVVGTYTRRAESGQIIAVINYTIGSIARRELTIIPFLAFGAGLMLMAHQPSYARVINVMFRFLGFVSLCWFGWLVWEQYLDAVTPPFVYATLRLLFGLGWATLGYLLLARGSRLFTTPYRRSITRS